MGTLRDLQFALQLKIEELRQRDTLIDELELELDTKDELIRRLQEELDRYRATVALPGASAAPCGQPRAKRKTIISETSFSDSTSITDVPHRSFDKSPESERLIQAAFSKNDLLKNLDETDVRAVTACMFSTVLGDGDRLLQEGVSGDTAYVLEEGLLHVTKDGQKLHTIEAGHVFGEESLLCEDVRPYTVSALTDSRLWAIERRSFRSLVVQNALSCFSRSMELLSSVPFLQSLPQDVLMKISDLMEEARYSDGDYIFRQGATGDTFYIISAGQVTVTETRLGHGEHSVLLRLSRGQWFGEKALWGDEARPVSAVAAGEVKCLVIDRDTFRDAVSALEGEEEEAAQLTERLSSDPSLLSEATLEDFQIICTLGIGEFGPVDLVQLRSDASRVFAMRVQKKQLIVSRGQREHVQRERRLLMEARCPFIVRLHRVFSSADSLYLLTDVGLGGDFSSLLRDRGPCDDGGGRFYAACVVVALNFLHSHGIVYRDIKPENLVLDESGYAKLLGSRCAKKLEAGKKTWTFCGTAGYMAPEVILSKGHDASADLWSLGVFVFELLSGDLPFGGPDHMTTFTATIGGIDQISFPKSISRSAASLIKKLCRSNPAERLGSGRNRAKDVHKHKWFEGFDWDGLCKGTLIPPIIPKCDRSLDSSPCRHYSDSAEDTQQQPAGWDTHP